MASEVRDIYLFTLNYAHVTYAKTRRCSKIMPTLSIHQKQMRKRYINFSKILSYQVVGICISVVLMSFEIKRESGSDCLRLKY